MVFNQVSYVKIPQSSKWLLDWLCSDDIRLFKRQNTCYSLHEHSIHILSSSFSHSPMLTAAHRFLSSQIDTNPLRSTLAGLPYNIKKWWYNSITFQAHEECADVGATKPLARPSCYHLPCPQVSWFVSLFHQRLSPSSSQCILSLYQCIRCRLRYHIWSPILLPRKLSMNQSLFHVGSPLLSSRRRGNIWSWGLKG